MAFLFRLLSHLPLWLLHAIGTAMGLTVYALSSRDRRITRQNLTIAGLGNVVSPRQAMTHAGRALLELPWLWLRPQHQIVAKVVAVSGQELVDNARSLGKGVLFLTPHLGCFEITAQYLAAQRPITVLYSRPKQAWLVPIVEHGRGVNLRIAAADIAGVRTLMRALRNGEDIGMLPDQVPGTGEGVWVPFFGKPAYTMTLAARLAESGATVLLIYAERLAHGRGYHVNVRSFPEALTGSRDENTAAINRAIEGLVRECPQQYAWNYNRYKVPAGVSAPSAQSRVQSQILP
jgi:KDO2-lipid IV(A) lauroyltransferase